MDVIFGFTLNTGKPEGLRYVFTHPVETTPTFERGE